MDKDKQELIPDSSGLDPKKVLKFHSEYKSQFVVLDSTGAKIGKGSERPGTAVYVCAHTPDNSDSFGSETETLDMAKNRIRDFFRKNGYTFEE